MSIRPAPPPLRFLLAALACSLAAAAPVAAANPHKPAQGKVQKTGRAQGTQTQRSATKPSAKRQSAKKKSSQRAAVEGPAYGERDDVMRFAADVADRRGIDAAWLRATLGAARQVPAVARLIMPPPAGTAKNWAAYRARVIEPQRIRAGVAFWAANRRWLERAEKRFGVPPAIVVGIVGVETIYGRDMGGFRVIDALATLSFDFPGGRTDRSAFFREELEQYLLLAQREGADALALRGSYAGAMGMPQFMPSSVGRYAVDFDGDGHIDLRASAADVIGSVAHYLADFGWQRGLPTHVGVSAPADAAELAFLLAPDIVPSFSAQDFAAHGAVLAEPVPAKLALVALQNGGAAPRYVAGTANFYAITRYNWSSYYAMAVITLGDEVMRRVAASDATDPANLNDATGATTAPR